ncbi:hypothetical protein DFH27DRAFT_603912 [Peziza echinospora]|nr:hypothetical protein DFH27DRAFT_603912 [Peziza echinospora]
MYDENGDFIPYDQQAENLNQNPRLHHPDTSTSKDLRSRSLPARRYRDHLYRYGYVKRAGKFAMRSYDDALSNPTSLNPPNPYSSTPNHLTLAHNSPKRLLHKLVVRETRWRNYTCPCCVRPDLAPKNPRYRAALADIITENHHHHHANPPWEEEDAHDAHMREHDEAACFEQLRRWECSCCGHVPAADEHVEVYARRRREEEERWWLQERWRGRREDVEKGEGWGGLVDRALGEWEVGRRGWSKALGWEEVPRPEEEGDEESLVSVAETVGSAWTEVDVQEEEEEEEVV